MGEGFVVAGGTTSYGAGNTDFLVIKLSSTGTLEWARTFGGANSDFLASPVIQTPDGGFLLAGHTENYGAGDWDFLVIKLSSTGNLEWARVLRGTNTDCVRSVIRAADGGFTLTGWTLSFGAGSYDFLAVKISSTGTLEWASSFGGTGWDDPFSITQTQDNAYVLAGWTDSFGASSGDFLILKTEPDGNYANCVDICFPTVMHVSPLTTSPTAGAVACSPTVAGQSPTAETPNLTITDACLPQSVSEGNLSGFKPGITCSPFPGGILFFSSGEMPIKIYSADGRLTYSANLKKGKNLITLESVVYLWNAGTQTGKATVR